MKLPFKQGIVKYQTTGGGAPTFLYKEQADNYISLYVSPTPTIVTFAQGDVDYLHEEPQTVPNAWGPFTAGVDYWLYWDINIATAIRTFGFATTAPVFGTSAPSNPVLNQHWFDTINNTMYYWNNLRWVECIRVFAGSYAQGSVLTPNATGSQVGINTTTTAGFILFDENENPVRRARLDGKGRFLTTESQFYSNKAAVTTVSFEAVMHYAVAKEDLSAWNVVSFTDNDGISLASNLDADRRPAFGMLREGLAFGSSGAVITGGYISNPSWNWAEAPSTPLYLGEQGALLVDPPGVGFIQQIATIISPDTIFVNILPQILHYNSAYNISSMPVEIDLITGKLTATPPTAVDTTLSFDNLSNVSGTETANAADVLTKTATDWQPVSRASILNTESIDELLDVATTSIVGSDILINDGTNWINHSIYHMSPQIANTTWTVVHNIGQKYVHVTVYDDTDNVIIPLNIIATDDNTTTITFNSAVAGTAVIVGIPAYSAPQ